MPNPRYRVRIAPASHRLEVELTVSGLSPGTVRFELPSWVPGAYGFMKYARDLFEVKAFDAASGESLPVTRDGWSGFKVERAKGGVRLEYLASASDHSFGELAGVVEHHQAVLLGTRYLYAVGQMGPCEVEYELPKGWALHHPAGAKKLAEGRYEYPSYAALLDAPVVAGQFEAFTRTSHGVEFSHLFLDRGVGFDTEIEGFLDSVMKIVDGCFDVFGHFPFERYSFIYTFSPGSDWGLEHANATMITLGEQALIDPTQRWAGVRVCAHELFHAWNVCRLKPAPLGKLDHARGSFPDALWVAEGFTRYYEFLLCTRAREATVEEFFSNVVNYYRHLTAMPAHARVSATDSSLATFLNHNKYPGSINNTIDYYDKGMLVAFDLDVLLHGKGTSLDQTFSGFYAAFVGKGDGYTSAQLRDYFGERAREAAQLIRDEVETPGGLSVPQKLEQLGFQLERGKCRYLGLVLEKNAGPSVANVLDTAPAGQSGLMPGDKITKVDGFPFELKALKWLVAHRPAVTFEVKRGHRYFEFKVPTGERDDVVALIWRGTPEQAERIRQWLKRDDFKPNSAQKFPLSSFENFHGIQTVL